MNIPLGAIGKIVNSSSGDHMVRVDDDTVNTGGFLIYEWWPGSTGPNKDRAFDSWVESKDDLQRVIEQSGWLIEWATETPR